MIILDTHIWIWWVHNDPKLPSMYRTTIIQHESTGLGISIISCWEVAKLVEKKRLTLSCPLDEWFDIALNYPNIVLLPLSSQIICESVKLPAPFHNDPADQLIVATARLHKSQLMTVDDKIRSYAHVDLIPLIQ